MLLPISRFFIENSSLQSFKIPITYKNIHLVPFRNKYCKKPQCIYDKSQLPLTLDPIYICNICHNSIQSDQFYPDKDLQYIIDIVHQQLQMTRSTNSAFKIECHAIELHRDGNWTPLYYQTDKNSHIVSQINTKQRGNILPSLSEQSEKQFQEYYNLHIVQNSNKKELKNTLQTLYIYPNPSRPDKETREVITYYKLSLIEEAMRCFKIRSEYFIQQICKTLMRTFVKYIENQAYRSLNNRRFLINAFECYAKEENKSKKDLFNFVLFDKKEIVYSDSLYCNYDDLLAVFLYQGQWYCLLYKIQERNLIVGDFSQNYERNIANLASIVKEFLEKYYQIQYQGHKMSIYPSNNVEWRVQNTKNDNCGNLVMCFVSQHVQGKDTQDMEINVKTRGQFMVSFCCLLLKLYHEQVYVFAENLRKNPKKVELQYTKKMQYTPQAENKQNSQEDPDFAENQQNYFNFEESPKNNESFRKRPLKVAQKTLLKDTKGFSSVQQKKTEVSEQFSFKNISSSQTYKSAQKETLQESYQEKSIFQKPQSGIKKSVFGGKRITQEVNDQNNKLFQGDILDYFMENIQIQLKQNIRIQFENLKQELEVEKEKEIIKKQLKQNHFEDYFKFLLEFYKQNDIKQYHQLVEEYNERIRNFAISGIIESKMNPNNKKREFDRNENFNLNSNTNVRPVQTNQQAFFNRNNEIQKDFFNKNKAYFYEEPKLQNIVQQPNDAEFIDNNIDKFIISKKKQQKYIERTNLFIQDSQKYSYTPPIVVQQYHHNTDSLKSLFSSKHQHKQKVDSQVNQHSKYNELRNKMASRIEMDTLQSSKNNVDSKTLNSIVRMEDTLQTENKDTREIAQKKKMVSSKMTKLLLNK